MEIEPPLQLCYYALMEEGFNADHDKSPSEELSMVDYCELPLVDLGRLNSSQSERDKRINEIVEAASEWGLFEVVNHGVPEDVLKAMKHEQKKAFYQPFVNKTDNSFLNLRTSYRWGNKMAVSPSQMSWSEALRIAVLDISRLDAQKSLRSTVEALATKLGSLARCLAEILGQNVGIKSSYFQHNYPSHSSFLRLNRYPPCPVALNVYGLIPHTDTDFLTVVYQDRVGGLQVLKHGTWFAVKPNPQALLVNIGDLFQAMSNDVYKSLEHRVVAAKEVERLSLAYFYCPLDDAIIESLSRPTLYRRFSFDEYKKQIENDVRQSGNKVGFSRFLIRES